MLKYTQSAHLRASGCQFQYSTHKNYDDVQYSRTIVTLVTVMCAIRSCFQLWPRPQVSDPGRREGEEGAEGSGEAGQDARQEQDRPTRFVENSRHFDSFDKDGDEGPYLYLQLVVFVRSSIHVCVYVTETKAEDTCVHS